MPTRTQPDPDGYAAIVDLQNLDISLEGGLARVVLNRPDRRNALSYDLLLELDKALGKLGDIAEVRVISISGAGPVFSAGHDLSEMIDREPAFYENLFNTCTNVMEKIQSIPQPVIAQVHGVATAAGCQLVAACDLAVASADCRFATPGIKIGLFCSTPMVPLTRAIGRKRAMQMLITGDPIDAATALDWGLVNLMVGNDELGAAVSDLADRIMRFSRDVIEIGKATFYEQVSQADGDAYRVAVPAMSRNAQHRDAQEGMQAFLEKRPPDWPSHR